MTTTNLHILVTSGGETLVDIDCDAESVSVDITQGLHNVFGDVWKHYEPTGAHSVVIDYRLPVAAKETA